MMRTVVAILSIFLVFTLLFNTDQTSVNALTCPRCTMEYKAQNCETLTNANCPHGVTSDMCGCCNACYKGENDECGGIWNRAGFCADAFECTVNPDNDQYPGNCVRKAVNK